MMPKGWKCVRLGEVITYKKGYPFDSSDYQSSGVRVIRISDTTEASIHDDNPVFIKKDFAKKLCPYLLNEGDIILSTVGSRPHLLSSMVGKAVKVSSNTHGSLLNQNLVKLIAKKSLILEDYLYATHIPRI